MTIVTLYALLGDDLRLIYAPKSADPVFTNLTIVSLVLFSLELILSCFGYEDYFNSFFFWLDLVSTTSLITDIEPIMNAISGIDTSNDDNLDDIETQGADANPVALARASRGAKLGSKAGRLTRVIRIIRLIRIVKLYKSANKAVTKQQERKISKKEKDLQTIDQLREKRSTSIMSSQSVTEALQNEIPESRVGKTLS